MDDDPAPSVPGDSPEIVLRSRDLLRRSRDLLLSSNSLLQRMKDEEESRRTHQAIPEPPPGPG